MPSVSEAIPYLTPEHVKLHGKTITITGPGTLRKKEESQFGRATIELPVRFDDAFERIWTPNSTTLKRLAKEWSDETEAWVNKKVQLEVVKVMVRGEVREAIYGEPPGEQTTPTARRGRAT